MGSPPIILKNNTNDFFLNLIYLLFQVVGIFAGFGVLLLVASPFLLLAAPCILCCKCKVCKCCEEEDEVLPTWSRVQADENKPYHIYIYYL